VRQIEPVPKAPSQREDAVVIAERLSALLECRRGGSAAAAPMVSRTVVGARHSGRLLGNLLLTRGFIVEYELQYALARQESAGGAIGQILIDLGLITDRDLVELLAEQLRMQVVDVAKIEPDRALRRLLPHSEARRLTALPLRRVDGQIDVVMADPTDDDAVGELIELLGAPLRLFLATRADIDAAVERLYDSDEP
jgi:MSHA biogenesis protein MshE